MLKESGLNYDKRRANQGMQTNLSLREEIDANWLPKCNEIATEIICEHKEGKFKNIVFRLLTEYYK